MAASLPPLLAALAPWRGRQLWRCDPMHGNTRVAHPSGLKTRRLRDVIAEARATEAAHAAAGSRLAGLSLEVAADDVRECAADAHDEAQLSPIDGTYQTLCDPRLTLAQALELLRALEWAPQRDE